MYSAPAPNPPLVPFPTPPSSRTRRTGGDILLDEPEFDQVFVSKTIENRSLPPHLQTLLTLQHAYNLALSLHIATKPPILPPHPPSTVRLELPCLTNYLAIKETVERTGGRRFGTQELARLAWIWQWDGVTLPKEEKGMEDDNPFYVKKDQPSTDLVCAMSYLITPTRTLDGSGKRVHTYGLGIELDLKPGETRQILHNGAEGGLGNKGQGGGMGAVGRWNTGGELRHDLVREKLEKWIDLNGGYEVSSLLLCIWIVLITAYRRTRSRITYSIYLKFVKIINTAHPDVTSSKACLRFASGRKPLFNTVLKLVSRSARLSDSAEEGVEYSRSIRSIRPRRAKCVESWKEWFSGGQAKSYAGKGESPQRQENIG